MIPQWIRKSLVACVAVLTFGTVIPTLPAHYLDKQNDKQNVQGSKAPIIASRPNDKSASKLGQSSLEIADRSSLSKAELIDRLSTYVLDEAKNQGTEKFGARISAKINGQYANQIAPAFAEAFRNVSNAHDSSWIQELEVTHAPTPGLGERIMHVYNKKTGKEVIKLHVRRDHPPLDGYYFNFHYHTALDGFQKHHELKTIYWGKNMPPKWKA